MNVQKLNPPQTARRWDPIREMEEMQEGLAPAVEFGARWSHPRGAMPPVLESVIEDPSVPVKVFRVNAEENEVLTEDYGVRAVPTVLLFNQGIFQDQIVGRAPNRKGARNWRTCVSPSDKPK